MNFILFYQLLFEQHVREIAIEIKSLIMALLRCGLLTYFTSFISWEQFHWHSSKATLSRDDTVYTFHGLYWHQTGKPEGSYDKSPKQGIWDGCCRHPISCLTTQYLHTIKSFKAINFFLHFAATKSEGGLYLIYSIESFTFTVTAFAEENLSPK